MPKITNTKPNAGTRYDVDTNSFIKCDIVLQRNGYWVRSDTFDSAMVRESLNHYKGLQNIEGKVVLDLGANCGGFTKMALEAGAQKVIAIEPCPYNFEILEINAPLAENINGAITELKTDSVDFFYSASKRSSSSGSTCKRRNYSGIFKTIPAYNINEILEKYKPSVVKMDIEGKEYDILDAIGKIPEYIEEFAIEFHWFSEPYLSYPQKCFEGWKADVKGHKRFGKMLYNDFIFRRK